MHREMAANFEARNNGAEYVNRALFLREREDLHCQLGHVWTSTALRYLAPSLLDPYPTLDLTKTSTRHNLFA
jgi:hypothetical protein